MTEIDKLFSDWDKIKPLLEAYADTDVINDMIDTNNHLAGHRSHYDGHGFTVCGCIRLPHD